MKKKYTYLIIIFLIATSFAAFGRIAGNDFINFDDNLYITENNHIKSGVNPESIKWVSTAVVVSNWHPLTLLSHILDWSMFGANASGHHLVSLLLHIGAVIFLFLFLYKTTNNLWPAAFAAAFFALHPLRGESVAWASERKDVLSIFFGMACLYAYAFYAESSKLSKYLLCLILFALALMSKPMMVTLPFVLLLLDYWPLKRWPGALDDPTKNRFNSVGALLLEKVPFFCLTIASCIVTFWAQNKVGSVASVDIVPFLTRAANAAVSYVVYLEKIFWPVNLAVFYPYDFSLPLWKDIISGVILILITLAVIYYIKKLPFLFVGWFTYLGTLVPVIGLVQVGNQSMADRYTYLPSIGIAVMLAWGIPSLIKSENTRRKILFPVAIAVLFILTILTWRQCGYWKNSITLFSHTLRITNDNALAHNNLGLALFAEGKSKEAIDHYSRAINIAPGDVLPHQNRGIVYAKLGQYQQAINDYNEALRLKPDDADVYDKMGIAYAKLGLYQKAFESLNKALSIQPDYANIYNSRGIVYNSLNQHQQSFEDFTKAILLRPDYADAYYNRGTLYHNLGRYQQAIDDLSEAIRLKPDNLLAYFNRGGAYINLGQYHPAIEDLSKVISLDPASFDAYNNRGFIYLKLGRYQQALEDYSKAIILKPDYADAYNNRALVYLSTKNMESGCQDAKKACELGNCATLQAAQGKGLCR